MKLKITFALWFALVAISYARPAEEVDSNEAAPAKSAGRSNPLLNRRNPIGGRGAAPKSTTTTTEAPAEEVVDEEYLPEEEEGVEEEIAPEPSSTTEPGRKLKGGIVRPFRSNQDLLETLKKRREQVVQNKSNIKAVASENHESAPVSAVEPEKNSSKNRASPGGRGRFNKKEASGQSEEEPASSAPAKSNGRRFKN